MYLKILITPPVFPTVFEFEVVCVCVCVVWLCRWDMALPQLYRSQFESTRIMQEIRSVQQRFTLTPFVVNPGVKLFALPCCVCVFVWSIAT